ncbi:MAG TPA: mannosyltransferase family protein [Vicinamibacterales bacterium]|nr:mannosyltransferase family protein [Vicinamibacterales bacterium]
MKRRLTAAADAAAVVALCLASFVAVFGGFNLQLGPLPISVHGAGRLLFIALALVAIRHAANPADPLHRRLLRGYRARRDGTAAAIVPAAVATRVAALLVGYMAVNTIGVAPELAGFTLSPRPLLNLPARFDAGWYGGIALDGYSFQGRWDRQQNIAFFPAFPMLARIAGYPLGAFAPRVPHDVRIARLLWAGVLISFAAFGWAAVYLWRLTAETVGEARAPAAVALLASYPFAVFFSAPYTESLFLLGCLGCVYHFRRRELSIAAAWGLLVGLTRPNGCLLSVVLAVMLIERYRELARAPRADAARAVLAAAAPGFGMLLYSAYIHQLTGDFFGWARLQETWGRSFAGLAPVGRAYGWLIDEGLLTVVQNVPYDTMNSLGLIFALAMVWPVARRLGWALALFVVITVIPPLLAGGVLSMGRLTSTLFPLFIALAAMVPPRAVPQVVTAFAIGQGLAAALFFTWRPLF